MDRQDAHQQKRKEKRESKNAEQARQEKTEEIQVRTIHPGWFVVLGIVLIVIVVMFWTMI